MAQSTLEIEFVVATATVYQALWFEDFFICYYHGINKIALCEAVLICHTYAGRVGTAGHVVFALYIDISTFAVAAVWQQIVINQNFGVIK